VGFPSEKSERDRLPEPELNPMMNPKLGQNLGRWAQVYFTAPPEKRKEAVEELLRELESEDPDYVPPAIVTKTRECPNCGERNESGHKFCGICGTELNGTRRNVEPTAAESQEWLPDPPAFQKTVAPPVQEHEAFRPVAPPPMVERRIAPLPVEVERRIYKPQQANITPVQREEERESYRPAPPPRTEEREVYRTAVPEPPLERPAAREVYRPAPAPPPREEPDVEWLRERTLVGLTEEDSKSSGVGKYIVVAALVIIAAFAGLEWASRKPPKTVEVVQGEKPKTDSTPPQVNQDAPQPAADHQPVAEQKPPTKTEQSPATEKTATRSTNQQTAAEAEVPASQTARIQRTSTVPAKPSAEPAPSEADMSGAQELLTAEGYLQGRYGSARNTSEAAKWLWKSVAKQNSTASVLLANLYMQGDGVSKSCDQARLLLVAAAKKGSSAAAQSLRNLESGGCK
jgi:hypothetical protein